MASAWNIVQEARTSAAVFAVPFTAQEPWHSALSAAAPMLMHRSYMRAVLCCHASCVHASAAVASSECELQKLV